MSNPSALSARFQPLGSTNGYIERARYGLAGDRIALSSSPEAVLTKPLLFGLTIDIYSHVIPALNRAAADRMDALPTGSGEVV